MGSDSRQEYLAAILQRYHQATREEKGIILQEFCAVCSYHHKHEPESQPKYTPEEKESALELLKDPDLLERLIETTEKLGCVGEENNKIILFLTLLSRKLDDPISLTVKGDSSGGKSYQVDTVCRLFPREELKIFTTITPKALYHRTDDLSHKALIIFERPGTEDSDYSIRSLQSEKKLIISMSVKDPKSGRWVTEDHEIAGPIAYIETTTKSHLNDENETRCFEIYIDDSEQQTERIHRVQKQKYGGESHQSEANMKPWVVAQYLLKPYPVIIPYRDLIRFPSKPLRARRDHTRFLAFIEVSAILHQCQREKKKIDGADYLVANEDDYAIAYNLASTILQQTIKQISPKAEGLVHKINEFLGKNKASTFTRRQIAEFTRWDIKIAKKYLDECLDQGLIEIKSGGRGSAYEHSLVRMPEKYDNLLLHPDQLREKVQSQQLSNLSIPIQNSIGQVNILTNNKLGLPIQPDQGNKDVTKKTNRKDAGAN